MSLPISDSSVSVFSPSTVGGTGTTAKVFPSLLGPSFQATVTAPASVNIANNGVSAGKIVTVKAAGTLYVHGTSPTVNFVLQAGTSLTASSNTTIATLAAAQSLTTATQYPFAVQVDLQGDSTSGIVQVVKAVVVCNGVSGSLTLTDLTSQTFTAAIPLALGVTFGVSDAANTASLYQFVAEA